MSDTSAAGHAVALPPIADRFAERVQRADGPRADLDARIVERAKGAISARLDTPADVAFQLLAGLARSQGREIEEYAEAVFERGGRLDA